MKFAYTSGFSSPTTLCTREVFEATIHSPQVKQLITAYRRGDKNAKKKLPAFCFHATFKDYKRLSSHAVPSGLFMVDFDHLTPEALEQLAQHSVPPEAERDTSEVMLVHITPSGRGLRVVCKAQRLGLYQGCNSLSDYQHVFARKVGGTVELDEVTTDLARLSFAPMADDVLYVSPRLWDEAPEVTAFGPSAFPPATAPASKSPTPNAAAPSGAAPSAPLQDSYKGTSLDTIFSVYFESTGGYPPEGARNSRFYAAARDLRYICDFNPAVVAAHLPDLGLPYNEVISLCTSACQSGRSAVMPETLQEILRTFDPESGNDDDDEWEPPTPDAKAEAATDEAADGPSEKVKGLPFIIRAFTDLYPPAYHEAITLALLPILGTLGTKIRARYLDGEIHSPSFMSVITAEQASGKSFARKLVRYLLASIADEDKANREIEKAYQEQLKASKNSKKQPEAPRVKVRLVPPSISIAKLLQRLDGAECDHLFSFSEELDTVIKSNRSGAWAQKTDIYRNAFDNADYGQDYMSDSSYSAVLPVYYNMLFCGTPRQTAKFFDDVENGLTSRFCFASLPDQFGARMPNIGTLSEKTKKRIERNILTLREAAGLFDFSFLHGPLNDWLETERLRAITENDRARDTFRRRSAVIGFRAAMCVAPLYRLTPANRTKLGNFACYIASLVLKNQLFYAGERLNKILDLSAEAPTRHNPGIFQALPEVFTRDEVAIEMRKRNMHSKVAQVIWLWKREGLITKNREEKTYTKNPKS